MRFRYRVNFGNGQVEYVPGDSRVACERYIADPANRCGAAAFVEFQDPDTGDWCQAGLRRSK